MDFERAGWGLSEKKKKKKKKKKQSSCLGYIFCSLGKILILTQMIL